MCRSSKYFFLLFAIVSCQKNEVINPQPNPGNSSFSFNTLRVNGKFSGFDYKGINTAPVIEVSFTSAIDPAHVPDAVSFNNKNGISVPLNFSFKMNDSLLVIQPLSPLAFLSKYSLQITTKLKSTNGGSLLSPLSVSFLTEIDSTDKFPAISTDSLLTLIQKQTFSYFWDFGHPVSGMARERSTSGETVTTGGSGFGVMAIPVAIERKFITRSEGLARVQTILDFLEHKAGHFHGAFSHWMNGTTGEVVPFGVNDDGADIVETSYMMMGLLTARQYFNRTDKQEDSLRSEINRLWDNVDWNWFRKDGGNVLYWNWSPDHGWAVNVPVRGWNECLITYVLAASSRTHPIPKVVYDEGFAGNGAMINNNNYLGIPLPLGPPFGGPLFFEEYSFLGIDPFGLADAYAYYQVQTQNHAKINYQYCISNPKKYFGYSNECWGLTACDIPGGYSACSPANDLGVIAPTAAISAIPYTPSESIDALKFFYYKLGDKIWGQYGFVDAFNLDDVWFDDSFLAIDQGPQIGMIENYRSGLLWNLFMSCPEVQDGLFKLGFHFTP